MARLMPQCMLYATSCGMPGPSAELCLGAQEGAAPIDERSSGATKHRFQEARGSKTGVTIALPRRVEHEEQVQPEESRFVTIDRNTAAG